MVRLGYVMDLIAQLEAEGFDHATAETILQTADKQTAAEAEQLLRSMLSKDASAAIQAYLDRRQQAAELEKKRARLGKLPARITVKTAKLQLTPRPAEANNEGKIESVKDLEAALKQLSIGAADRIKCDCMGSKHGLLEMAPNCLSCGRVVCNREGMGPCMFCGVPLLPTEQLRQIRTILSTQRDAIASGMSKRALHVAGIDPKTVKAASTSRTKAEANLEKLLGFQAHDSERTRIIDRANEVDVPNAGAHQWMTADEQAEHIRQQQQKLRKLEKQRKAALESNRRVISIDSRGKKTYQVYAQEHSILSSDEEEEDPIEHEETEEKATTYYEAKSYESAPLPRVHVEPASTKVVPVLSAVNRTADEDMLY